MAKRIKYLIGDLFLVPVNNQVGCLPARVLRQYKGTMLIEVYRTEFITEVSEFNKEEMFSQRPILTKWCYHSAIKRGDWVIVGNEPVTHYDDLYLWTYDYSLGYVLLKCTETGAETTGIMISKEETQNYSPYGISTETSMPYTLADILENRFGIK